jgi:hypothetical protein
LPVKPPVLTAASEVAGIVWFLMLTDAQVRLMRLKRMDGKGQKAAAAAAGMSERSARTWQEGALPSATRITRDWRTRRDPFGDVWDAELVPLLKTDDKRVLQATTLIELLQERHPGQFIDGQARTLQRRLRDWRAINGPTQEVFFEQTHVAGREAAVDFTHATELGVTIRGVLLEHLLFEFVLSFSGWTWLCLAFSETYEALVFGIQGALAALGGAPEVLRSDNLSAATHELRRTGGRALVPRFKAVLDHYGMSSTRIQPGESHENGVVEQRHRRTKRAIAEVLVIRGSKDFDTVEEYTAFVVDIIGRRNRKLTDATTLDRAALRPLPAAPVPSYSTYSARVRRWSTIRVGGRTYSVPSRLIGHLVEIRQHPDIVEVIYRGHLVETMPRLRGEGGARIDYRHVIWSLVRKPGAFARYRYREELFPTLTFRRTYDALCASGSRADVEYLRILHLAASTMQSTVEQTLIGLLDAAAPVDFEAVRARVSPLSSTVPIVAIPAPDLRAYDHLLAGGAA